MEENELLKTPVRPRFRSIRYNVSHCKTTPKIDSIRSEIPKTRNRSIINVNKLGSISNLKKVNIDQNYTVDATSSNDRYLRTFLSFASKDFCM